MLEIRSYGTICPTCRRVIPMGEIRLQPGAQSADLRNVLYDIAWKDEIVECTACKSHRLCELEHLVLLPAKERSAS